MYQNDTDGVLQTFNGDEDDNLMPSAVESVIGIFIMSLGNFGDYWDNLEDTEHQLEGQVRSYYLPNNRRHRCDIDQL